MSIYSLLAILLATLLMVSIFPGSTKGRGLEPENCPNLHQYQARLQAFYMAPKVMRNFLFSKTSAKVDMNKVVCALKDCKEMGQMDQMHKDACGFKMACEALRLKLSMNSRVIS